MYEPIKLCTTTVDQAKRKLTAARELDFEEFVLNAVGDWRDKKGNPVHLYGGRVVVNELRRKSVVAMVDGEALEIFPIDDSWAGYEPRVIISAWR